MVVAIIMAAGFSRRMNKEKLLLDIQGESLIEKTIKTVKKSNVDDIILVYRNEQVKKIGEKYGLKLKFNDKAYLGQSESIKAGVKECSKDTEGYMFFVADQPFLNSNVINSIIEEFKKDANYIIVPVYRYKNGNPVIFPYKLKKELLSLKGDIGGRNIINKESPFVKYINIKNEILGYDIDTIEQYNLMRQIKSENNL